MNVNDKQIGGDHYKNLSYEVWDFVTDMEMPFILGSAVKYIARFKNKNGIDDLKKSSHFLEKAIDLNMIYLCDDLSYFNKFAEQFDSNQGCIIYSILLGNFDRAIDKINSLIEETNTYQ